MPITLVQKNKSKGILTWYARVPDPHKKGKNGNSAIHFFSLGTTSKSEAKAIMQERIKGGFYDIKSEAESLTLSEAAVKFEQFERAKGVKSLSIETISHAIKSLKPLFDKPVAEIKIQEISEVFQESTKELSPVTSNNRRTALSMLFNYIVDVLEIIPRNPIAKAIPKRKVPKKKKDFWTLEQIDRIIAKAPNPNARLIWSFMAFAGLRKSEAVAMRPEKIYDGKIHLIGKGDKEATIPICPRLQREIDRYKGDWKLFFNKETLKTTAARAIPEGFPGKAHAHRFRYSFGSNLVRAGKNIKVVQELMRHEDVKITLDLYCFILESDTSAAVNDVFK